MIAQPPHGLNAHVRADGRKLFAQEADAPLTRGTAAEILYRAWQMENELIAKA